MDLSIAGKMAMVVGAGADVGRATAIALAREGAIPMLVGRSESALVETAELIGKMGARVHVLPTDINDPEQLSALIEKATALGGIELLANTAGPFPKIAMQAGMDPPYGDDESWYEAFDNVFMSAARLTRHVMPLMKEQGAGSIVHLGANSTRYFTSMTAQFGAMKAAMVHGVRNWARDGAEHGVRVNAVLPGWIKGDMIRQRVEDAASAAGVSTGQIEREWLTKDNTYWTPRMGLCEEYADAIVFLLSPRASYISGALMPVTGGSIAQG